MEALLKVKKLTAGYGKKCVVCDVSLDVNRGEMLALIGPNGAGKSTLLRTIAAQQEPLSGEVLLETDSVFHISPDERARHISTFFFKGRIGADMMTCRDVVAVGRYPYTGRLGILSADDRRVVDAVMERLFITELSDTYFDELSDGQKQRVLIARALCQEPDILILDEPASYLDIRFQLELMEILRELAAEGLSVVVSMHELSLVKKYADRVLCVYDGRALMQSDVEELFSGDKLYEIFGIEKSSIEF